MKKMLKQKITGYTMPRYMTEILTQNYSPAFLRMSIIRENNTYMFTYDTGTMKRLVYRELTIADKLVLLQTILELKEESAQMLISAENYLIEPELIYSSGNSVREGRIRLLFYPDLQKRGFEEKFCLFIDKLKNPRTRAIGEEDVLDQVKAEVEAGDPVRVERLLKKLADRWDDAAAV